MSTQAKKRTSSQKGRRRSHHALKKVTLSKCPQCGRAVAPHIACDFCGTYKGKEVIKVKAVKPKTKKEK